jgi:hypothetical protein
MNGTVLTSQIKPAGNKSAWALFIATMLTLILYFVPFLQPVAYPFILLSTLVHEMTHGVAAVMVGGHFDSFQMWGDGSGVALINGSFNAFSKAFIAGAGLIGPALVASLCFYFINSQERARFILGSFAIILALSLLLVVRNLFGLFFVALLCGCCLFFSIGKGSKYAQIVLAFIATQLGLSVFSRSDYLFTDKAHTSAGLMPSDVAQIADALILPYWFWGALCGLFSLLVLAFGIKRVFRS